MGWIMGTVLGFLTGLGLGGGSLLMLWLTLGAGLAQQTARQINLLFFLPAACVSCAVRGRQGALPLRRLWPAIAAGAVSAGLCTVMGAGLQTGVLRRGFGLLLLAAGVRELLWKPGNPE